MQRPNTKAVSGFLPPLVAAIYCTSIYLRTIKWLLLVISYSRSFSYAPVKYWNIRDVKARREIMIPGSLSPQIAKRIMQRFDIGIKKQNFWDQPARIGPSVVSSRKYGASVWSAWCCVYIINHKLISLLIEKYSILVKHRAKGYVGISCQSCKKFNNVW